MKLTRLAPVGVDARFGEQIQFSSQRAALFEVVGGFRAIDRTHGYCTLAGCRIVDGRFTATEVDPDGFERTVDKFLGVASAWGFSRGTMMSVGCSSDLAHFDDRWSRFKRARAELKAPFLADEKVEVVA